jgi:hypothetical protein
MQVEEEADCDDSSEDIKNFKKINEKDSKSFLKKGK